MCFIKFIGYFILKKKYYFYVSLVKYLLIFEL